MRLFGIAFLALVLAALVFLAVDRRYEIANGLANLAETGPERRTFEVAKSRLATNERESLNVTFSMEGTNAFPALVGFPAFAKTSFPLPKSSDALTGVLVLDIRVDLEMSAKGILKVSVNGSKRAAIVLEHTRPRYEIRVQLNLSDLALDQVTVGLATEGITQKPSCSQDWVGGSVVQITPISRLELRLTSPLTSLADRLAAAGTPAKLLWDSDLNASSRARLMGLAWIETIRGRPVQFISNAAETANALRLQDEDLKQALELFSPGPEIKNRSWPVGLAQTGHIARAQHFDDQAQWTSRFDLRTLPNQEYPGSVHIGLDLEGATEELLLTVEMNGSLIHSEVIRPATRHINRTLNLPRAALLMNNELAIRLVSAEENRGDCARGRPKVAQLTSETRLLRADNGPDTAPEVLTNFLEGTFSLSVDESLSATAAMSSLILLQKVARPQNIAFEFDPQISLPLISILSPKSLELSKSTEDGWVLLPSDNGLLGSGFALYQASDPTLHTVLNHQQPRTVLLISSGQELGG
jgi:hypothetical protein